MCWLDVSGTCVLCPRAMCSGVPFPSIPNVLLSSIGYVCVYVHKHICVYKHVCVCILVFLSFRWLGLILALARSPQFALKCLSVSKRHLQGQKGTRFDSSNCI